MKMYRCARASCREPRRSCKCTPVFSQRGTERRARKYRRGSGFVQTVFRMCPELDSRVEGNDVPLMLKLQFEEIIGTELRSSGGICVAPYIIGGVEDMVRRT